MIYKTHHVAGLIAAESVVLWMKPALLTWDVPAALASGFIAGILADADQPQSKAGQRLLPLALLCKAFGIKHRTLTHSILFLGLIWFLLSLFPIPRLVYWSFLWGYVSHPLIDLLNEQGVELLFPISTYRFNIPFIHIGIDGLGETLFRLALWGVAAVLFLVMFDPYLAHLPVIGPYIHSALIKMKIWK